MASRNVLGCLAIASMLYSVPQESLSGEETVQPIHVTYAVMMEGSEPFFAEVSCLPDSTCQLARHNNPDIELSLTVHSGSAAHSELRVYCSSNPCSFQNLRSSIDLSDRRAMVDIFSGERASIVIPLVFKPRPRIGEVLISY
ncbi:hypothetical protein [Rhizobium sp. CCGE 510]|uniref:hypothetical protein n=1 Tax=Rhizobium sp. CCGE 510 TaxID=1132836 RepID=UPI00027B83C2|nr:hypothetical protein [Rhizobium sp. CCGE 510]EJT05585.1 hypothetical protein RCCGE510_10150 [Rhizobium sp. CCGE 510]